MPGTQVCQFEVDAQGSDAARPQYALVGRSGNIRYHSEWLFREYLTQGHTKWKALQFGQYATIVERNYANIP